MNHLSLLSELTTRGFFYQTTPLEALSTRMQEGPLTVYAGFDATGPSFHVGHLVILLLLKWLHRSGHNVIILLGGGTTQVGDPSDKKSARPLLALEMIEANLAHLLQTVHHLFPATAGHVHVVNNKDWLEDLGYMTFLREIGRHFSVNRMVNFEFVRNRLEKNLPLSFLELNYMLLQAYDFLQLHNRFTCQLQIGGADQWANIINGVELVRKVRGAEVHAITCPLLTTASGEKMGKTATGAVWLREALLSPYDFWQFWRNVDDRDVGRFLKLFTFLPLEEIAALETLTGSAINDAKCVLADQVTTLIHGATCLESIHQTTSTFFSGEGQTLPSEKTFHVLASDIAAGWSLLDCLVIVGFATSKSEARRLIRAGGVRIDDQPITDEMFCLSENSWCKTDHIKLSIGTKKHLWLVYETNALESVEYPLL